jgi:hypothetical protein
LFSEKTIARKIMKIERTSAESLLANILWQNNRNPVEMTVYFRSLDNNKNEPNKRVSKLSKRSKFKK